MTYWTSQEQAKPITVEQLRETVDKILNEPRKICGSEDYPHILHPRCLKDTGWFMCMNCGRPYHFTNGEKSDPQPEFKFLL